jgi:hypothetical protein
VVITDGSSKTCPNFIILWSTWEWVVDYTLTFILTLPLISFWIETVLTNYLRNIRHSVILASIPSSAKGSLSSLLPYENYAPVPCLLIRSTYQAHRHLYFTIPVVLVDFYKYICNALIRLRNLYLNCHICKTSLMIHYCRQKRWLWLWFLRFHLLLLDSSLGCRKFPFEKKLGTNYSKRKFSAVRT